MYFSIELFPLHKHDHYDEITVDLIINTNIVLTTKRN